MFRASFSFALSPPFQQSLKTFTSFGLSPTLKNLLTKLFVCRCEFEKNDSEWRVVSDEWFFWGSRLTPLLHYDSDW